MEFGSDILKGIKRNGFKNLEGIVNHSHELQNAMKSFLEREEEYRLRFGQTEYEFGFDGYSFPGQLDSINQAYDDHLHSMVISEFYDSSTYPVEFKNYLEEIFPKLIAQVKQAINFEAILSELGLTNKLGFSFSVNYYPSFKDSGNPEGRRLTEHIDGSLLTIFPYGFSDGLQKNEGGTWKDWPSYDDSICLPGYMMDLVTNGNIKALNHRLNWSKSENEGRFAFALFIVPKPNIILDLGTKGNMSSEEYYKNYLALFD